MKFPAMPFFRILSIAAGFCMIAACSIFFLRADVFFFPPPPGGQPAEGAESTLGSTFPSDRDAAAKLTRAQDALAQGQFADGVQLLDRIIRSDQDTFFQPKSSPGTYRSLKREARAALGKLPQAGWESYELQFGAIAQEQLEQAATAGDLAELGAVSRQYFYTRAGLESCWLLAHAYLDRGEARKAAGFLERLNASSQAKEMFGSSLPVLLAASWISADAPEQARAVLHEMKESTRVLELAGSRQAIFGDESDAVEWLERITSIKAAPAAGANSGETAATENVDGSIPLLNSSRWQQPLLADSVQHNSKTTSPALNASQVTIPSEVPLTIGDWVVVRTGSTIVGIDFVSGKRVWEYQTLDSEEFDRFRNTSRNKSQSQVQVMGMLQQLCRRTISADSNRVYTLERHRDPLFAYESDQFVPGTNWTGAGQGYTKLLARELAKEGKLAWELGGPTEDPTSPLAGIYFLGAPLSLNDQLYVIGERQQQIALYVLDSATGKLAWWQPLVHSDIPIEMDLFRQAVGASPSHCDGIMLCPTSEGSIVAIDLLDRSLVWGLRYPRVTQMAGGRRMRSIPQNVGSIQWTDCDIVFSNGKALVTPVDSDTLYCVNVNSGQTDWSMAKAGMIYNGGVQNGTVVLIGKNTATGVNLSDGSKVWGPVSLAESADQVAAPSGQGYMNSESCFVPLSSAEVVELEIATGKVKARARCRKQSVPGNLVSYQGTTISQSERLLDCFFQFDQREKWAKEILQDRPSDPEALAAYGEILIDQGDLTGGVAKLLAALEQSPTNAQLQTLLIDTYFEGLRTDFAGHFSSADRIEKVLANGPQRAELHCLLSTGLRESGKLLPAFEHCIKVYQTAGDRAQVVQLPGGVHTVRLDRWCQEQIQGLLRQSSPADQLAIDERIQREADAASDSVEIAPLRKFLSFFGTHPSTSVVRERFVEQLVKRQQWSEVEWVLLTSATDSAVPPAAQRAVQLAELMVQAGRWDDASVAYQYLITNLPKAKVKGDLTGEQFFEQLAADSPIRKRVQQTPRSWPDGEVQTKTTNGSELASRSARLQPVLLSVRDGAGLYLSDLVVENAIQCFYDLRSRQLMGVDGEGRDRFRFPLAGNNRANFRVDVSPNNWIRACGHMLLIHVSYHLCAVDTLGDGQSKVLWSRSLSDFNRLAPQVIARKNVDGSGRPTATLASGIWPVGDSTVCIQTGMHLIALDARTGEQLWQRNDVQTGAEIYGDDEQLFLISEKGTQVTSYRTSDGSSVNKSLPLIAGRRIAVRGRILVVGHADTAPQAVVAYDLSTGKQVWKKEAKDSLICQPFGDDEIALLTGDGEFSIVSIQTGNALVSSKLKLQSPPPTELRVYRSPAGYVAIAATQVAANENVSPLNVQPFWPSRCFKGLAFGIDRQSGAVQWTTEIGPTATVYSQPSSAPFLIFAANVREQITKAPVPHRSVTEIKMLDLRNGSFVKVPQIKSVISSLAVRADWSTNSIEFYFDETPIPATP